MLGCISMAWGIPLATELTVGPGGDVSTLEAAWNTAPDGARLRLLPGVHTVSVALATDLRDLTLESADPTAPASVLLDLPPESRAFSVDEGDHLRVRHLDVTCAGTTSGFEVSGTLELERVDISGCTAFDGGAVYSHGGSTVRVFGGRLTGNHATDGGGAIYSGGTTTIVGTELAGNTGGGGGALRMNSLERNTVQGGRFEENQADSGGAGYTTGSGGATWVGNTFLGNSGGLGAAVKHSTDGPADFRFNAFTQGFGGSGGGLMLYSVGTECTVRGNRFFDNEAESGGHLLVYAVEQPPCTIDGNRFEEGYAGGGGGGVFLEWETLFTRNLVCTNTADLRGGGIRIEGGGTLSDNLVLGNLANQGGAVDTSSSVTITNNAFAFNEATVASGSAFRVVGGDTEALLRDNVFFANPGTRTLFDESGPGVDSDFNALFDSVFDPADWSEGTNSLTATAAASGLSIDACSFEALDPPGDPGPTVGAGTNGGDIGVRVVPEMLDADSDGFMGLADCNDADASVFPGAQESCAIPGDDDCDGLADDEDPGAIDAVLLFLDTDGDGVGVASEYRLGCPSEGWSELAGDCAPDDPDISPLAAEIVGNALDDDCDGTVLCFADADLDGFGAGTIADLDGDGLCESPGESSLPGDCNDASGAIHPGAPEVCNGVDDDCDERTDAEDPEAIGTITGYRDTDGDGFGRGDPGTYCTLPATHATVNGDCDDTRSEAFPGAPELCNGLDDDCDPLTPDDCPEPVETGDTSEPDTDLPDTGLPDTDPPLDTDPPEGTGDTAAASTADTADASDVPVDTGVPQDTGTPDTDAPDTDVPETDVPDTDVPETDVPDTDLPPETDVPETDLPDTDGPDTDVPSDTDGPTSTTWVRGPTLCSTRHGAPAGWLLLAMFLVRRRS
ncbi:MAG: MopE-related protein [Myxococcota bacterium]